ncbi:sugar O-acetyltransferase [Hymenobacter arizonensis]|uniref:Maltose O-acetyltransferase n=1 Tax=Hymenobacter arizonensis TaxID=1227077 RepID=A0A1I5WVG0_HYMAR|nr:sugar O-acetyltransferase [Hymenobacter arizonensis]SFQ23608.1 maltose O-acetyltransferase [Hymenobacter arizonensis]
MKTEKEKMLAGEPYNAQDPQLVAERRRASRLFQELNHTSADEPAERARLLEELIPHTGTGLDLNSPFYCDYGTNIRLGDHVFFNFNCTILDVALVTIGSRTLFGPNVQIYTATHPLDYQTRAAGLEGGEPVVIGDDVWVGGGAIILPGVTVGSRTVIGAGSVVTKDLPADVVAAGNPCRVIRKLSHTGPQV